MKKCIASLIKKLAVYLFKEDPLHDALTGAAEAARAKNWPKTIKALNDVEAKLELKENAFNIAAMKGLTDLHAEAVAACKKQDSITAGKAIGKIMTILQKTETQYQKKMDQMPYIGICSSLKKLAETLLDAAYKAENDPIVKKTKDALAAASRGNWNGAIEFLRQIEVAVDSKERGYKEDIPALKGIKDLHKNALAHCKEQNPAAIEDMTELVNVFKKSEDALDRVINPVRYRAP